MKQKSWAMMDGWMHTSTTTEHYTDTDEHTHPTPCVASSTTLARAGSCIAAEHYSVVVPPMRYNSTVPGTWQSDTQ